MEEEEKNNQQNNEALELNAAEFFKIFLKVAAVRASIIAIVWFLATNDSVGKIVKIERDVTTSDFSYTTGGGFSNLTITVTPNKDIKSLSVSVKLLSSDNKQVFADTISKENLLNGYAYTYTFESGFFKTISAEYISCSFAGKVIN